MSDRREPRLWNRRELIAAALGAAATPLVGCQPTTASIPLPAGDWVGANVVFGHRSRDLARQLQPSRTSATLDSLTDTPAQTCEVIVIGAGVSGLSAARRLQKRGVSDFFVLELESVAGGTARGDRAGVFPTPVPWGAHYIPVPMKHQTELIEFLSELNAFEGFDDAGDPIPREEWSPRAPESRFWLHGSWYDGLYAWPGASAQDLAELERFEQIIDQWVTWRDEQGRRAFVLPADQCSDAPELQSLDQQTIAQWLDEQGFQSQRLRDYVDYACRDDYGLSLTQTSAWAGLFYFAARQPSAGAESRPYLTWPDGNGHVTRHLANGLSQLRLATAAIQIIPGAKPSDRCTVLAMNEQGSRVAFAAKQVIFAAPQMLASYLIPGYAQDPVSQPTSDSRGPLETRGDAAQRFQYAAWIVANLQLDRAPQETGFPLSWDNVIHGSRSLGYLATSYQRGLDYGPPVLTWYYPVIDDDPTVPRRRLLELDRDAWAEIVLTDLEPAHPDIRARVQRLDVMRWGHAMIQPIPGFRFGLARQIARQPYRGIHFAHSDTTGLPLFEEAFDRGWQVADQVLQNLNSTPAESIS